MVSLEYIGSLIIVSFMLLKSGLINYVQPIVEGQKPWDRSKMRKTIFFNIFFSPMATDCKRKTAYEIK